MKHVCFSETLVSTYEYTRCHNTEQHGNFHRRDNFKSHIPLLIVCVQQISEETPGTLVNLTVTLNPGSTMRNVVQYGHQNLHVIFHVTSYARKLQAQHTHGPVYVVVIGIIQDVSQ
jgi:hypothetical protein